MGAISVAREGWRKRVPARGCPMSEPERFRYTEHQRSLIDAAIPKPARALPNLLADCIWSLENAAFWYLCSVEESAKLPDRDWSRERREQVLNELRRVRDLLMRDEGLADFLENHRREIYEAGETPTGFLCKMFANRQITRWDLEHAIATKVLDDLIRRHEAPSYNERMKDGKSHSHRKEFIERAVDWWAAINQIPVSNCVISATEGTPMLSFMQAALAPVLALTGESIGSKRIWQIVCALKGESASESEMIDPE
jgi:hypothetical protein